MAEARVLVEELDALRAQFIERAVDILHFETDVEEALAMLRNPARGFRIAPVGLKQLDICLTHRKHRQPGLVLGQKFFILEIQPELGLEQLARFFQGFQFVGPVLKSLAASAIMAVFIILFRDRLPLTATLGLAVSIYGTCGLIMGMFTKEDEEVLRNIVASTESGLSATRQR